MAGMEREGKRREGLCCFMAGYMLQWVVNGLVGGRGILCC